MLEVARKAGRVPPGTFARNPARLEGAEKLWGAGRAGEVNAVVRCEIEADGAFGPRNR